MEDAMPTHREPLDIGAHYVDAARNDESIKENLIAFAYAVYLNKNARVSNTAMWSTQFDEYELNKMQSFLNNEDTLNSHHVLNPRFLSLAVSRYHVLQRAKKYEKYVAKNADAHKEGRASDQIVDTNVAASQWTVVEREIAYKKSLDRIFM